MSAICPVCGDLAPPEPADALRAWPRRGWHLCNCGTRFAVCEASGGVRQIEKPMPADRVTDERQST